MAIHGELPGTPPHGPDPELEWVTPGPGVMGALRARLGSDVRAEELVVAVVGCLRGWLARDTFDGVLEELPWELGALLRGQGAPAVLSGRDDVLREVGRLVQRSPAEAAWLVRAVFACLRKELPRGLADAIPGELPTDVAALWNAAR
jgi:uncharacterized protein (DUF2267 family)